jgi:hypothetical protein
MVFNMDEVMVEANESNRARVFVPRDWKKAMRCGRLPLGMHITLILGVSADGGHLKPTAILPLKTFPKDCWSLVDTFNWAGQSEGWINRQIFEDWVEFVFIPHVNDCRDRFDLWDQPCLLWLDGHSSRESLKAIDLLQMNNIVAQIIPSHTSHVMQPLDRGVNRKFKSSLRRHFASILGKLEDKGTSSKREAIMKATEWALHEAMFKTVITDAFETAGIVPWNPALILNDPTLVSLPNEDQLDEQGRVKEKSARSKAGISSKVLTSDRVRSEVLGSVKSKIMKREAKSKVRSRVSYS